MPKSDIFVTGAPEAKPVHMSMEGSFRDDVLAGAIPALAQPATPQLQPSQSSGAAMEPVQCSNRLQFTRLSSCSNASAASVASSGFQHIAHVRIVSPVVAKDVEVVETVAFSPSKKATGWDCFIKEAMQASEEYKVDAQSKGVFSEPQAKVPADVVDCPRDDHMAQCLQHEEIATSKQANKEEPPRPQDLPYVAMSAQPPTGSFLALVTDGMMKFQERYITQMDWKQGAVVVVAVVLVVALLGTLKEHLDRQSNTIHQLKSILAEKEQVHLQHDHDIAMLLDTFTSSKPSGDRQFTATGMDFAVSQPPGKVPNRIVFLLGSLHHLVQSMLNMVLEAVGLSALVDTFLVRMVATIMMVVNGMAIGLFAFRSFCQERMYCSPSATVNSPATVQK